MAASFKKSPEPVQVCMQVIRIAWISDGISFNLINKDPQISSMLVFLPVIHSVYPAQEATSGSFARQFSRPGEPGAPKVPRNHNVHGNKTSFVFRSLPPHPDEAPEQASLQHLASSKSVKSVDNGSS